MGQPACAKNPVPTMRRALLKASKAWGICTIIRRAKSRSCLTSPGVGRPGFGLLVCPLLAGAPPPGFKSLGFTACFYSGPSLSRSFPGNGTTRLAPSADACRSSFSLCVLSERARDRAVCLARAGGSTWDPRSGVPPRRAHLTSGAWPTRGHDIQGVSARSRVRGTHC